MRADNYLRLGGGLLGAGALIRFGHWVFVAQGLDGGYTPSAIDRLRMLDKVLPPLSLASTLGLAICLLLFARATHRADLRVPAVLAGIVILAATAVSSVEWTARVFETPAYLATGRHRIWAWTVAILTVAGPIALLGFSQRAWRGMSSARLAFLGLGIAWTAGLPLWELAAETVTAQMVLVGHPWYWLLLVHAVALGTMASLASALFQSAYAAAQEQEDLYLGWPTVAIGLRYYGNGLAWRISITFVGMFLLFMAAVTGSGAMVGLFGFLLPVALLATSLVMATGVAGYARQPTGSGGAAPAWISFAALLLGICFDIVAAIIVVRLVGGLQVEFLSEALKDLSAKMTRWGLITGGVSLGAMLLSFGVVASHLRRRDMVGKVLGLVVGYALTIGLVVAFVLYGPNVMKASTGLMVVLGLVVVALILALAYLRLVRSMEVAIEAAGDGDGLPQARVVDS